MNNISKLDKDLCTGCSACQQTCPKGCIEMIPRDNGFLYPSIDTNICIDCGKCLKVCPAYNKMEPRTPLHCYAAYNKDEDLRLKSSSGGVFIEIAKYVINLGGVVFGAVFDDTWNVHHVAAQTIEEVYPMMGSKYVQSRIENTFIEARKYLKEGRYVLFSGTPCQIAGLNRFLVKDYSNLITIDLVCHGVPGIEQWNDYIKDIRNVNNNSSIEYISFRDKRESWQKYHISFKFLNNNGESKIYTERAGDNSFMRGFLNDLYLRESCYVCPSKMFASMSDFTFGDLWGYKTLGYADDVAKNGIALLAVNTNKANKIISDISSIFRKEISYNEALLSNPNLIEQTKKDSYKIGRYKKFCKRYSFNVSIDKTLVFPLWKRIINKIIILCIK